MSKIQGFYLDPSWFKQIDEYINDNKHIVKNFKFGMDSIVMLYANFTVAYAQEKSLGPLDPQMSGKRQTGRVFVGGTSGSTMRPQPLYSPTAWKIPVRRITGDYFRGWYAQREGLGQWIVSNHSREAYFIEFGINHPGTGLTDSAGNRVRVRRPILKLAMLQAINTAEHTRIDMDAFTSLLTQGMHSSKFYETPTHGAGRTYPVGADVESTLSSMAGSK